MNDVPAAGVALGAHIRSAAVAARRAAANPDTGVSIAGDDVADDRVAGCTPDEHAVPLVAGPGTKTYTSSFYLYTVGFAQFHLSQATAGSWLLLILTAVVISFLVRRLLRAEPT